MNQRQRMTAETCLAGATSNVMDFPAIVTALIDAFDRDWSRFRPDSLVTRLAAGGTADAPP